MVLIETVTVGSGGASAIEFTGIPATATDLFLLVSLKITKASGNPDAIDVRFNGDTGSNYTTLWLEGSGSSVASSVTTTSRIYLERAAMPSYFTANTFGSCGIYISNYASSSAKSVSSDAVTENNATLSFQAIHAGVWTGTDAINTVRLFSGSSTIVEHSSASLYKITAD